ncbi:MAG: response regulator transcription factor [Desulfotalea sp.]
MKILSNNHLLPNCKWFYLIVTISADMLLFAVKSSNFGTQIILITRSVVAVVETQKNYAVLIVEDDLAILGMLSALFQGDGASVQTADDGLDALALVRENKFDLIFLDVIVPSLDGFSLLQKIREIGVDAPIIMLTDQQMVEDKVRGLEFGADDYVTKPFSPRELLARARVQLRRQVSSTNATDSQIAIGSLTIDAQTRELTLDGKEQIHLTKTEFDLFLYLSERKDGVVTHESILTEVLHYQSSVTTKAVVMHIANIRRKLSAAGATSVNLKAISGVGYRLLEV